LQMKLLESQKNYRAQNRPAGRSIKIQHQASIIHNFKWLVLIILLIIGACEEKIPTLQTVEAPLEFVSITSYADSLNFAQRTIEPSLGKSDILFVGNDEHVYAYMLLKFANLSALPDTLDSLISVSLNLQTHHQFQLEVLENQSIDISIFQLNNSGIDPWTEDSTNFKVNNDDLKYLTSHLFTESDTLSVTLDTNLVVCWHDSSNTDYTLVLQQSDTSLSSIQAIYSKDAQLYPWLEVIYIQDGARDTIKIIPSEDLSILSFKTSENSESHMFINSGRSSYSYIKFNFEDELHDKNTVIAQANLHLTIDTVQSQLYGENFHLYFNFLDSALLADQNYNPLYDIYNHHYPVGSTDTVAIIDIKKLIQGVVSFDNIDNHGIVIWAPPTVLNISTFCFCNPSDQNPVNVRPYLEILTMKEQ